MLRTPTQRRTTPRTETETSQNSKTPDTDLYGMSSEISGMSSGIFIPSTPVRETQKTPSTNESCIPETQMSPLSAYGTAHESRIDLIINIARTAFETLDQQKTTGQPKVIRDDTLGIMKDLISSLTELKLDLDKQNSHESNPSHSDLQDLQSKFAQMAKDMEVIKAAVLKPQRTTWADVAAGANADTPRTANATRTTAHNAHTAPEANKRRLQREKFTITITAKTAPEATKNQLKTMHAKDIIQKCQSAIAKLSTEGRTPKIHGINKRPDDTYKLHCESEQDPELLGKMDWNSVFTGVTVSKRKYGLVVHGVPKNDLDPTNTEDQLVLRDEIEEENLSRNLQVEQVTLLRRSQKHLQKAAAHHSIVIFTHSMQEADRCLKRGMFIKGKFYVPEKYTPELNITQCFKCFKFGHLAKHCRNNQKCGNCGNEDHDTTNCNNATKCSGCGDPHPAWHIECGKRDEEGNRLKILKQAATNYYSE
jgi:hypothetical protein